MYVLLLVCVCVCVCVFPCVCSCMCVCVCVCVCAMFLKTPATQIKKNLFFSPPGVRKMVTAHLFPEFVKLS